MHRIIYEDRDLADIIQVLEEILYILSGISFIGDLLYADLAERLGKKIHLIGRRIPIILQYPFAIFFQLISKRTVIAGSAFDRHMIVSSMDLHDIAPEMSFPFSHTKKAYRVKWVLYIYFV